MVRQRNLLLLGALGLGLFFLSRKTEAFPADLSGRPGTPSLFNLLPAPVEVQAEPVAVGEDFQVATFETVPVGMSINVPIAEQGIRSGETVGGQVVDRIFNINVQFSNTFSSPLKWNVTQFVLLIDDSAGGIRTNKIIFPESGAFLTSYFADPGQTISRSSRGKTFGLTGDLTGKTLQYRIVGTVTPFEGNVAGDPVPFEKQDVLLNF